MQPLQQHLLFRVPEKPPVSAAVSQLPGSRAPVSQLFGTGGDIGTLSDEELAWRELFYQMPLPAGAEQSPTAQRFRQQLQEIFGAQLESVVRYTEAEQRARQPLDRFAAFVENLRLGLQETASAVDLDALFALVLAMPNLDQLEAELPALVLRAQPTLALWQQWLQLLDPGCTVMLAAEEETILRLRPDSLCPPGNTVVLELVQSMLRKEVFASLAQPFYSLARVPGDAVLPVYLLSTALANPDLVGQLYLYATAYANAELLATPPELSLLALLSSWVERCAEALFALALGFGCLSQVLSGLDAALDSCVLHFLRLTRCAELLGVRCCGPVFSNFIELQALGWKRTWSYESRYKPWLPAAGSYPLHCNNIATMLGIVKADRTLPPSSTGDLALCRTWAGAEARFAAMREQAVARPDEPISQKLALSLLAEEHSSRATHDPLFQTARRTASGGLGVILPPASSPELAPVPEEDDWPQI